MKQFNFFFLIFAGLFCAATTYAQDPWPKNLRLGNDGKLTVYEPQLESLTGDKLTGRAAVSVRKTASEEPVFGAILFTSTVEDNASKKAEFTSLRVTNAKFPGMEDQSELDQLTALIEKETTGWNLGMSTQDLAGIVEENNKGEAFNNAAPKIIYANKPTTLVVLDGEPRALYDEELKAEKVANSPNLIFKEGKQWNLYAGGNWYKSNSITSGWKQNNNLSSKLESVNEQIKKQEAENNKEKQTGTPRLTDIIVATQPTELLQTDGEPVYKNVSGTSLLYVSNSPNEIFKDINTQQTYVLIAGRWYHANGINGPWTYISSDKLPKDFAKIPEGSDKEVILSNVAGTDAAEEAILDAEIPQTAKVERRTATIDVQYDGQPIFNRIPGTSLQLAENSNVTVMIDASGNYFALENGVWFISNDAYGPWAVANDRPRDIEEIPASSPAYHTKYVYVYDYTPDYVYTGYTSGYLGSYIYGPTIVYGTGYYYRPWFHRVYYPRPVTWGFGFMYDPWYGWNFNWGYNYGFMYVGFNFGGGYGYGGGWFGPSRYCPSYGYPYWHGGYYGRNYGYARRDYYGGRGYYSNNYRSGGSRPVQSAGRPSRNIYNNQTGVVVTRNVERPARIYRPSTIDRSNANLSEVNRDRNRNANRLRENNTINNNNRESAVSDQNPAYRNNRGSLERNGNVNRIYERGEQRPSITRPQREERPVIRERQSAPIERPETFNRQSESGQRPSISRPQQSERPAFRERQSAPIQRPEINRQSAPIQRPEINRQSAPVQRPEINRQSAPAPRQEVQRQSAPPQRSSPSQGGSPTRNFEGRRPDRR